MTIIDKLYIDFRFPSYPGCHRQRIWTCLRKSPDPLKVSDVQRICGTGRENTRHYLNILCRMGYVQAVRYVSASSRGGRNAVYRLVRDTGPLYPVEKKVGHIFFDPNTGEVWSEEFTRAKMLDVMRKAAKRAQSKSNYQKTSNRPSWKKEHGDDNE